MVDEKPSNNCGCCVDQNVTNSPPQTQQMPRDEFPAVYKLYGEFVDMKEDILKLANSMLALKLKDDNLIRKYNGTIDIANKLIDLMETNLQYIGSIANDNESMLVSSKTKLYQLTQELGTIVKTVESAKSADNRDFSKIYASIATTETSLQQAIEDIKQLKITGGPKGDKGDKGDIGPKGDKGDPGANGSDANVTSATMAKALADSGIVDGSALSLLNGKIVPLSEARLMPNLGGSANADKILKVNPSGTGFVFSDPEHAESITIPDNIVSSINSLYSSIQNTK